MAIYRAIRNSPYNNWRYRLDIVPYDENLNGNGETLPEGCVVDFGDLEYGFDDVLPYGLANPATWSVTLNFSRLPSELQTRLRNKYAAATPTINSYNTFLYWTDSGTNGATWTLLFCGVVENTEGAQYDVNDSGELETTYNLIDGAYHSMLDTPGSWQPQFDLFSIASTQSSGVIFEHVQSGFRHEWINNFGKEKQESFAYFIDWNQFAQDLNGVISDAIRRRVARTINTSVTYTNFDVAGNVADMINTGVRFRGYQDSTSGAATTSFLDDDDALLLRWVVPGTDMSRAGGFYSTLDEYSIVQAQCVRDQLADLCETLCVKMYWHPQYVTDAGGDYIAWNVEVATLLGNKRANLSPATYNVGDALQIGTISEGAGIIGRSETRTALEGGEKNVSEFVTAEARSRSERSINIEPILTNLPTYKSQRRIQTVRRQDGVQVTNDIRFENGVTQNNAVFTRLDYYPFGTGSFVPWHAKAHHNTTVAVRAAANGGTMDNYYEANSNAVPENYEDGLYEAWLNTVQSESGIAKALTVALFNTFSNALQCEVPITWNINSSTLPSQLGAVHNLTGGIASTLTQYNWNKACVTKVLHSFANGTSEITYFVPGI